MNIRRNKMNLVTWKPMRPLGGLTSMHNRINRLFEDAFSRGWDREGEDTGALAAWHPTTDIYETKDDYVFKIEIPGLSKDDVKIEIKDNTLSIKGERKEEKEVKREDYHRVERCSGTFSRSFALPQNVDSTKTNATMKNGILELRVAKAEEAKPKSIPISLN
jgi:HSP20 family protein